MNLREVDESADYPALLSLDTGEPILIGGALNWIAGLPGRGKSMVVLLAAKQTVEQGGRVAILDYDLPPARTWKERALALGGERFLEVLCDRERFLLIPGYAVARKHREDLAR